MLLVTKMLQRKNPQPICDIKHLFSATHLPTLQRNIQIVATHLPNLQITIHLRQHTCQRYKEKSTCGNTLAHKMEKGNVPCICEFKLAFSNYEKHSV